MSKVLKHILLKVNNNLIKLKKSEISDKSSNIKK